MYIWISLSLSKAVVNFLEQFLSEIEVRREVN